jgi:hypothetical protein
MHHSDVPNAMAAGCLAMSKQQLKAVATHKNRQELDYTPKTKAAG